jgi:hypothetical protein
VGWREEKHQSLQYANMKPRKSINWSLRRATAHPKDRTCWVLCSIEQLPTHVDFISVVFKYHTYFNSYYFSCQTSLFSTFSFYNKKYKNELINIGGSFWVKIEPNTGTYWPQNWPCKSKVKWFNETQMLTLPFTVLRVLEI